jgi:hypothetical protein
MYPIGTLNIESIKDTIFTWVFNVTRGVVDDLQIVWRNQSEPVPPRPFIGLKIIAGPNPIARSPNTYMNPGTNTITVGMQMEATLSVQVFGNTLITNIPTARQIANDLNTSLFLADVLADLSAGGVAVQALGKVQSLTALEESEYEERSGFEIELGLVQNITRPTSTITSVNVEMETDAGNRTIPIILP